jgi:signal transduction histidine kinase
MRQVSRTGRDALADTRRVLDVLRDEGCVASRQPAPTVDTIPSLLTAVGATGLAVEMTVEGTGFAVTPTAQTALYRIVQEALTNSVKHAAATRAQVTLRYCEPGVRLTVVDDGTGGRAADPGRAGHGLAGMRERAALFGGTVDAGPGPDGGWLVAASLPRVSGPGG